MNASNRLDQDFMRAALSLARRGLGNTAPNPTVGCILVKNGMVVGRGWTQPGGRPHAEAMALEQAGAAASGATAYVTLEPCAHQGVTPPCAEALVAANIKRCVVALEDPDERVAGKGLKILKQAGINIEKNVLKKEAWRTNLGFLKRITEHRPEFTLKLATDRDGHIPPRGAEGEAKWITSSEARRRGHLLRAQHDAVIFGIGTVLDDDPKYTCRLAGCHENSTVRVLLDTRLRIPQDSKLLKSLADAPLWIVCGADANAGRIHDLEIQGVTVISAAHLNDGRPDLVWLAGELAKRGLNRVLVEAGPAIVSGFLQAGLVDAVQWFRADKALGADSVPAFNDVAGKTLGEKLASGPETVLNAGPDHLEIYHL